MKYINEYQEGEKFFGIYFCKSKQVLKTKAGKTYYSLLLQDKSGVVDGKIWDLNNAINEFDSMDYIMVDGLVTVFQGSKQINISRVRVAMEGEYDPKEYMPASKYDIEEMYSELTRYMDSVNEVHLRRLLDICFNEEGLSKEFKSHSAAKSVHHAFIGGLLQHTLSVTRMCSFMASNYEILDKDLLITAAILHDIGKIYEIADFPANEYTDPGQLLGHIYIGAEKIGNWTSKIPDFPKVLETELKHCILAHHGELEFGSPKKPAIAEAMALHFADLVDARMETMTEVYEKSDPTMEWLGFNRFVDSNVRQSSGYLAKRKKS